MAKEIEARLACMAQERVNPPGLAKLMEWYSQNPEPRRDAEAGIPRNLFIDPAGLWVREQLGFNRTDEGWLGRVKALLLGQ